MFEPEANPLEEYIVHLEQAHEATRNAVLILNLDPSNTDRHVHQPLRFAHRKLAGQEGRGCHMGRASRTKNKQNIRKCTQ